MMLGLLIAWIVWLVGWLFVLGCAVGSFLNVCVYRLPRGKNLFWPSSRCGACLTPIRAADNIPLVSYWRLGGRCRACGATFSMRYFWVELATGLVFVALYFALIVLNLHRQPIWAHGTWWHLESGRFPPHSWPYFLAAGVLASLLIVAGFCLVEVGRVPASLAVTGAVCGLAWSLLYPWPSPTPPAQSWIDPQAAPRPGFVPWPVLGPLPSWLPPDSFQLGLATGLAGLLLGSWLLRLVDWLSSRLLGRATFGPAPAALVLITGGFLGWQPVLTALALAALVAVLATFFRRLSPTRFALIFLAALVVTWLAWGWLGPALYRPLFDPVSLGVTLALLVALLLVLAARLTPPEPARPVGG